jgi:hypothetical protein
MQFLPIDDGHAQFFLLRRVKQHAFHGSRAAKPTHAFTSTLEREKWRGELPERARSIQKDAVPQGTCEHGFK